MRAILFILILAVAALLIAVGTGFLDIRPTRSAEAPRVDLGEEGVSAEGGQTPTFDIETGSVAVGTTTRNVAVPTVRVNPPGNEADNPVTNDAS